MRFAIVFTLFFDFAYIFSDQICKLKYDDIQKTVADLMVE